MTIEYSNNKFDTYSIDIDYTDMYFSTLFMIVKSRHNNDGAINKRYLNILINETKRGC